MTQISFKGSGVAALADDQIGLGQALQTGLTEINFLEGKIQLVNNSGHDVLIGKFRGLNKRDSRNQFIKSFVFKCKGKCTLDIDGAIYDYELLNEWITFKGINLQQLKISKVISNLSVDHFDWQFIASDDPNYSFTLEKGTRDSDPEIIFASAARAVNTYTQNINIQGAKKLILIGRSPASAETGLATVTLEVFDPASSSWQELVPSEDIFTLIQNQTKVAQLGDTLSKVAKKALTRVIHVVTGTLPTFVDFNVNAPTPVGGEQYGGSGVGSYIGYILPSGDNVLRAKVIVSIGTLTFSLGAVKVFN